jgi:hypothetical protein
MARAAYATWEAWQAVSNRARGEPGTNHRIVLEQDDQLGSFVPNEAPVSALSEGVREHALDAKMQRRDFLEEK